MSKCQSGEGLGWPHEESNPSPWGPGMPHAGLSGSSVGSNRIVSTAPIIDFELHIVGNPWKNWVLLRLRDLDGADGVGECSLNGLAKTTVACFQELSRCFLGRRPIEYPQISRRMLTDIYSDAGQLHRGVVAAVEMACLDILGKRCGLSVYQLLGGGHGRQCVPAYANGWYRVERTAEGFRRAAQKVLAAGYHHLKFDPFGPTISPLPQSERNLVCSIIHEVSDASRSGSAIEAHQRLDLADALWLLRTPAHYDCLWLEEPLPWQNLHGLREVASRSPIPLGIGENFTRIGQFEDVLRLTTNVIFQPDVMNLGGLTKALEVCRLAERYGIRVCPHDAQGPVSRACCVQLAMLSPAVWMLEDFDPWNAPWTRTVADTFRAEAGIIGLAMDWVGLGIRIHWDRLTQYPYDPNGWVPLFETGWERRRGESVE